MVIMFDNPPEPALPPEAGTPTTSANISGGVNLDAQRDVTIGGDVVGRDKIVQTIINGAPCADRHFTSPTPPTTT